MSQTRRAGIAIAVIIVAWCLMSLAYDKPPHGYFIALGILGVALFLGALGWWTISALADCRRRKSQNVQAQASGDVGRIDA